MAEAKGKKEASVKKTKGSYYKLEGGKLVRKKYCPKCGPGIFMAAHDKRMHCGKCGYTEFK